MPEPTTEPNEQAQAASQVPATPDTQTATDQQTNSAPSQEPVSFVDAMDQLATAQMTGAGEDEIKRLEAIVQNSQAPAEPVVEQAPVEPNEEQTTPPETPTQTPEEQEDSSQAEQPGEPNVSKRIRMDHLIEEERALVQSANLLAKAQKISFKEAWAKVAGDPQPQQQTQQAQETEAPVPSPEITRLEAELAEIEAKLDAAAENGDLFTSEIKELNRSQAKAYAKLEAMKAKAEAATEMQQSLAAQSLQSQRQESLSKAVSDYPSLKDRESAHWMLARAMAMDAQNPNHPDHAYSIATSAPEYFAKKAAEKLGLKPAGQSAPVSPSVPPPTPVQPQKPIAQPAPGHRQTTPPPAQPSLQDQIAQAEAAALAATMGMPAPQQNTGLRVLIR